MGSQSKKKKRTKDTRSITSEIKRAQDLDQNKLALQPTFELGYTPLGVNVIDFVNVSTNVGPAQGGSGFPAQVTGLTVTPQGGSNTQLNLAWTAITTPDFNYYNVYRGTSSGFTVDVSAKIAQPTTNSYNNTGLTAGTTYYYRVSTTNDAELEGAVSSQVSATTTSPPITHNLWLELNNAFTDSANAITVTAGQTPTFGTPGKFGSHFGILNDTVPADNAASDHIWVSNVSNTQLDLTSIGFSISLWIYPFVLGNSTGNRSTIYFKRESDNPDNGCAIVLDTTGSLIFHVEKNDAIYTANAPGFVVNQWQHVVCTFNAATNGLIVYRNAVSGTPGGTGGTVFFGSPTEFRIFIGKNPNNAVPFGTWYQGRIDEVQYFKGQILTPTNVTNLMNTNAP